MAQDVTVGGSTVVENTKGCKFMIFVNLNESELKQNRTVERDAVDKVRESDALLPNLGISSMCQMILPLSMTFPSWLHSLLNHLHIIIIRLLQLNFLLIFSC